MNLYFAYGSNMWREQMRNRCPNHRLVGLGALDGYRWIISSRGYANILRSPADVVRGVVYEISVSDEERLDDCEGVSRGLYRKELLRVGVNGEAKDCLVYVDPTEDEGKAKAEYVKRINKGIADAHLPADYVERCIRRFLHD